MPQVDDARHAMVFVGSYPSGVRPPGNATRAGQQLLLAFVTLAALLAMHGVGTHHGPAMPMARAADHASVSHPATPAMPMAHAVSDASPPGTAAQAPSGTATQATTATQPQGMPMSECVVVLTGSLLLLVLAVAAARRRAVPGGSASAGHAFGPQRVPHQRQARSSPRLTPTLTQLCILRA